MSDITPYNYVMMAINNVAGYELYNYVMICHRYYCTTLATSYHIKN